MTDNQAFKHFDSQCDIRITVALNLFNALTFYYIQCHPEQPALSLSKGSRRGVEG
jgi:hypothetical protein